MVGPKYSVLSAEPEKAERISSEEDSNQSDGLLGDVAYQKTRPRRVYYAVVIVGAICALLFSSVGAFVVGMRWRPNLNQQCLEHTSYSSSVMKEMNPGLHLVKFNGTFSISLVLRILGLLVITDLHRQLGTLGHKSEFSGDNGDPNPSVDEAWNKWAFVKYASFSDEEFASMGMDMEGSAKFTPEYGGGYIGFLEVSHHMHCLNVLRQALHRDYYEKPENIHWAAWLKDRKFTIKLHINHCVEMLRQNTLCNADVGVISHHWVKDIPDPFANFNTVHKCRDIGTVEKWIADRVVKDPQNGKPYPVPDGSKIWAKPP
ncbi:hypothetical protein GP486_002008 [Trichoglossum hirsutum]|uniref:Tat pathway signal sequence n=1 Tax=Trichoglossum hirsutum TaxID=265104 RepID=A0A9P8LFX1_9PEZI|nr:hypothetical protein GP486_002008 [Trichoglossum hirsutum]